MQEADDGRDGGADPAASGETEGVLERADDLKAHDSVHIDRDGRCVATLIDLEEIGEVQEMQGVVWRRLRFRELRWGHGAFLAILAGGQRYALFPPYLLTGGRQRPAYAPQPGMDDVRLVEILRNPEGLSPLELFIQTVKK
jgi:hypothetical protein